MYLPLVYVSSSALCEQTTRLAMLSWMVHQSKSPSDCRGASTDRVSPPKADTLDIVVSLWCAWQGHQAGDGG